jgi:hypothetical protein
MMFVSIVGQASFQTAGASGPSTSDRSKRRRSGGAAAGAALGTAALAVSAELGGDGAAARIGVLMSLAIYAVAKGDGDGYSGTLTRCLRGTYGALTDTLLAFD